MTTNRHKRSDLAAWFAGRLPDAWFTEAPTVRADREEILVIGRLAEPKLHEAPGAAGGTESSGEAETASSDDGARVAAVTRINGFREDTRAERIRIALEAEHLFGRKVSWGAACGSEERRFTTAGVPVMTRLRMDERAVLDTLIDAGVARSRSEALAWCVRLVGRHQADWIDQLRSALDTVERVRDEGPQDA